jgi:hypothetical protein
MDMNPNDFKKIYVEGENNGRMIAPEERPEDEMGRPLSLSEWGNSIKHRMFSKAQKVV